MILPRSWGGSGMRVKRSFMSGVKRLLGWKGMPISLPPPLSLFISTQPAFTTTIKQSNTSSSDLSLPPLSSLNIHQSPIHQNQHQPPLHQPLHSPLHQLYNPHSHPANQIPISAPVPTRATGAVPLSPPAVPMPITATWAPEMGIKFGGPGGGQGGAGNGAGQGQGQGPQGGVWDAGKGLRFG